MSDLHRLARRVLIPALLLCLPPSPLTEAGQPPLSAETIEALRMLHQGRFDMAASAFGEISRRRPGDPEGPIFEGLTAWWRLLDLPDDSKLRPLLDARLEEAVRRGEDLLGTGQAQRGRILAGTAYLLVAQARAFTGGYMSAGKAARRGHELLEEALAEDPSASDARFALGAYKYYAARLPWIVRLLRIFVRIPGGDAEAGLAALEDAAANGAWFRTEALLLLAYIQSGGDEGDVRMALGYLERAAEVEPGVSPLLAVMRARFLFLMGRLGEAERAASSAIEISGSLEGVAGSVPALARLRLSLAQFYQYRPAEAYSSLELLEGSRGHLPPDAVETFDGLRERILRDRQAAESGVIPAAMGGDPGEDLELAAAAPLPAGEEGARALRLMIEGKISEAIAILGALVAGRPEDDVARYHFARLLQMSGDDSRAREHLEAVFSSGKKLPKTLRGWAMIRMGAALEAMDRSEDARTWYGRAASMHGFPFTRAAEDRLKHPEESFSPEG
jgi:tetratricopeptide (TPR) repeat protein